jgi:hypothetical protein
VATVETLQIIPEAKISLLSSADFPDPILGYGPRPDRLQILLAHKLVLRVGVELATKAHMDTS